jgi:hypothetical protein
LNSKKYQKYGVVKIDFITGGKVLVMFRNT